MIINVNNLSIFIDREKLIKECLKQLETMDISIDNKKTIIDTVLFTLTGNKEV